MNEVASSRELTRARRRAAVEPASLPAPPDSAVVDRVFDLLETEPTAGADTAGPDARSSRGSLAAKKVGSPYCPPWVLHIDDDADFARSMKLRLEKEGIAVVRAYDGMEGFRYAMTKPADVILLDVEMPNGSGDYVLRRLKENPVTRDLPVIVLTAVDSRALDRKLFNLGAERVFVKPVDYPRLLRELSYHVPLKA